ncbi:ATP-binding protein, partial [Aeromicrobium sp.]|uniref:ATP-binding protein n=1 Tax=Aeromicrobium sp. TaxID=1871063 RepID=UPI003C4DB385
RELRLFKELFHSTEESRKPTLFVVDGEPGVGKSRLAWEFDKYIDGLSTAVTWHAGNCVAYGEGVAYYALAEAIRGRLRTGDNDDDDPAKLLDAGLERYVADEEERAWLKPRMGALLGIGSVGNYPREDLFAAWTTFLERVGEGDPVVLLIDDAQYADDGLLLFVEHLLLVGSFACFVVLLTRPGLIESNPSLATNRKATVAHLPALDPRDMCELLDGLVVGLPDDIRATLVERSDGIPLFAVETIRSLIDRDLVIPRGGQYVLADPQALDLTTIGAPASLQALIAARLDTLSAEERRVVDQASVVGVSFKRDTIAVLCEELPDVDRVLTSLVRLQILDRVTSRLNSNFGSYKFNQSVVRQVAYATLSRRDRKATHLAVVERYKAEGDSSGDVAAIVARHYLDAIEAVPADPDVRELTAAAIEQLKKAATRAQALGSPVEAVGHLETALAHLVDEQSRPELECDLAAALIDTAAYADAVVHASRATEMFDGRGDELGAGRSTAMHGQALIGLSDNSGAVALMRPRWDRLLGREEANQPALLLAYGLSKAGLNLGTDVRDVLEVRAKLAELAGEQGDLADALLGLSIHYARYGAVTLSRVLLVAAADLARSSHHPAALSRSLLNLTVNSMLDDLDKAIGFGREAVAVAKSNGLVYWISGSEINLALALWNKGQWDEVEEIFQEHLTNLNTSWTFVATAIVGATRAARGDVPELPWAHGEAPASDDSNDIAWRLFAEGIHARDNDIDSAVRLAVAGTTQMYEFSGTWDDCVHMWPIAVEMAIEASDDESLARLLNLIDGQTDGQISAGMKIHRQRVAGLLAMSHDPASVEPLLREAIVKFKAWGAAPYQARTEADLGVWLVNQGRAEEAAALLESARDVFNEIGAIRWTEALELQLGNASPARLQG